MGNCETTFSSVYTFSYHHKCMRISVALGTWQYSVSPVFFSYFYSGTSGMIPHMAEF